MKLLFAVLLIAVTGCNSNGNSFIYDRKKACMIDYGFNGFSVILDEQKLLVRNNRMNTSKFVTLTTAGRSFSTSGRYFSTAESKNIINGLLSTKTVYMRWVEGNSLTGSGVYRTSIDVSDFPGRYWECLGYR